MNFCKYVPSLWLSFWRLPVCNGLKSAVTKYFEPTALFNARLKVELDLSLSYDIVKAQGVEIKIKTKEGEGAGFTVQLLAKNI